MQNDNSFSVNPSEHKDKATSRYMKVQLFYELQHAFFQKNHILDASSGTLALIFLTTTYLMVCFC